MRKSSVSIVLGLSLLLLETSSYARIKTFPVYYGSSHFHESLSHRETAHADNYPHLQLIGRPSELKAESLPQIAYVYKSNLCLSNICAARIRVGQSNKIAVIGRKMDGFVIKFAELYFQKFKVPVETFSEPHHRDGIRIEGQTFSWKALQEDLVHSPRYRRDKQGFVAVDALRTTWMYKANKMWAMNLVQQGYTVIDLGYAPDRQTKSQFYGMELCTVFQDCNNYAHVSKL